MANEFIIRKGYKSFSDSQITGSLSVTNAVTASFFSGSFRGDGSQLTGIDGFPFTGSARITGSLVVVGPVNATTFTGDGSQLTGIEGFPYTGSAEITGSLEVTGSISTDTDATINNLTVGKGGGNQETNTVLGYEALISNVEGEGTVAIGYKALSSSLASMGPNTAVGNQALRNNIYGFRNTAVGSGALFSNTGGDFNTAVGNTALASNIEGHENIAVGDGTLNDNTQGDNNTGVGTFALHSNIDGGNNTGIGHSSLFYNTTGSQNVGLGNDALLNNVSGSNNIAIGSKAGRYAGSSTTPLTSINNSILLGFQARALNATGDTNEIVIGHNIVGLGSNTTVIGNNSTVSTTLKGAVSASLFSGSFVGDGSQLTGIEGFPFTGSARITGSLVVVGSVNATSFIGSLQGTATTASYIQLTNVDGFTAYSSSVNTAIGSVLNATTPLTATVNTTNTPFTLTSQSIVVANSTNGNLIINLPDLNTVVGTPNQKPIVVYKNDYSQNVIYVNPSGSQLINGASQDLIVSIQLAVIYNPTSAGWVTEGTSAQSLAELELFFVPKTETGSLSVATASYVQYNNVANKPTLVSGSSQISFTGITNKPTLVSGSSQISFSGITGKPTLVSGSAQISFAGITNKPTDIVSSSVQVKGYNVFATTGSNQFNGSQAITGSLTVTGQVVAQTLNVQQVTSSIVYSSGSNIFGNNSGNTQQFTGSVSVTGSLAVNGALSGTSAAFSGLVTTNDNLRALQTTTSANSQIIADSDNGSTLRAAIITFGSTASDSLLGILRASNSMLYKDGGKLAIGTRSAQDLVLSTNDTVRLTITSTGTATFASTVTATGNVRSINGGVDGTFQDAFVGVYSSNNNEQNAIQTAVSSGASQSGFRLQVSNGGGSSGRTTVVDFLRDRQLFYTNVGIGTTSPSANLHVVRANDGGSGTPGVILSTGNGANDIVRFQDGTTTVAVVKNSGNIGIGTTSPDVTGFGWRTLTIKGGTGSGEAGVIELQNTVSVSNDQNLGIIAFLDGTSRNAQISVRRQSSTSTAHMDFWTNAGAGLVERMRITSTGRVMIGGSSGTLDPVWQGMSVHGIDGTDKVIIGYLSSSTNGAVIGAHISGLDNWANLNYEANNHIFRYQQAEILRITSGGYLQLSNDGNYIASGSPYHQIKNTAATMTVYFLNHNAAGDGLLVNLNTNNTDYHYFRGYSNSAGGNRIIIYSNGNIQNANNSYGALSDVKLKENIQDASPKLDDLMKVKIRNYNLIGEETKQIGVIAQELEEVFPSMIDESEDYDEVDVPQLDEEGNEVLNEEGEVITIRERINKGTKTKSVKYSVFVPILIKAIQEQQSQIESLKAEIQTLKQ
jgi:hypothetical protein